MVTVQKSMNSLGMTSFEKHGSTDWNVLKLRLDKSIENTVQRWSLQILNPCRFCRKRTEVSGSRCNGCERFGELVNTLFGDKIVIVGYLGS